MQNIKDMVKIFALTLASLAFISGCSDKDETPPDSSPEMPVSRAQDEAYVKEFNVRLAEKKRLMTEAAKVMKEYEAARAEDPEGKSERFKKAEKARDEVAKQLADFHVKARKFVGDRVRKEASNELNNKQTINTTKGK